MELNSIVKKLIVNEGVFAPAEVSIALAKAAFEYNGKFLDLGTGSGFITIALSQNNFVGDASDLSKMAIICSEANFSKFEIQKKTIRSDFYSNIPGKYDLILYNPPMNTNETESDRRIKSLVKKHLPKKICACLSSFYQIIHSGKRKTGFKDFIEQTRLHLEENGVLLMIMLQSDIDWLNKISDKSYQITIKRNVKKFKVVEIIFH